MNSLKDDLLRYQSEIKVITNKHKQRGPLSDVLMEDIHADVKTLITDFLTLGNRASQVKEDNLSDYYLSHAIRERLSDEMKQWLLLMRNTAVQSLRTEAFLADKVITQQQVQEFITEAHQTISAASTALSDLITDLIRNSQDDNLRKNALFHYSLMESPWEIYVEQYKVINNQIAGLSKQKFEFKEIWFSFGRINEQIEETLLQLDKQIEGVLAATQSMAEVFSDQQVDPAVAHEKIEAIEANTIYRDELKTKLERIDDEIKSLKNYTLSINYIKGELVQKQVNMTQVSSKWLELYIVPALAEMFDKMKILLSSTDIAAKNTRNKIGLINEKNHEEFVSDINTRIDRLRTEQAKTLEQIEQRKLGVRELIDKNFKASNLYVDKSFLTVGLQSSVNQLMREQTKLVDVINTRFGKRQEEIFYFFNKLQQKEKLTNPEKIAYTLNNRSGKQATESYDQVFLSKDLFSEFYLIERADQQDRAIKSIDLWRSGYNGSMIVTGAPLSGKSTFANHVVLRHFRKNFLRLIPDSDYSYNGRKYTTGSNLKEALDNLTKSRINNPLCILIDDLELWHDSDSSLISDARHLIEFMARHTGQVYLIMTISPIALHFLNIYLDFSTHFLTHIDVSKCSLTHFRNIIQLRHSATQKTLVKDDGQAYRQDEFANVIKSVHKAANGNLGDGLLKWASGSREINSDQVKFNYEDIRISNLINKDNSVIFEQLFRFKNLSDPELIEIFTKEMYEKIRPELNYLLRTKILVRDEQSNIMINDLIINDVYKFYLDKFSNKIKISL